MRSSSTRIATLCVLLCLSLAVVRAQQNGAQQTGTPQRGGQAPAAPTGPLAPEKYKDIQVLTDLPADQLDVTMRYFVAATGFNCTGCHVRDQATGEFSYEKNDVARKATARRMINLVKAVNAGDFGARINCGTCHGGQNRPTGLQPAQMLTADQLAAMAAQAARQGGPGGGAPGGAPGGGAPGGAGRGQQTPTTPVDEIITKYIDAIGGSAAVAKIQSRVITGSVTDRAARSNAFTIEQKGDKYRETVEMQPSALVRGFDGANAWQQSGTFIADFKGFQSDQLQRNADLTLPAQLKDKASTLQSVRAQFPPATPGATPTPVNALRLTGASGAVETFIFDASSGLLLARTVQTRTGLNGVLNERFDYGDYRVVNGVKMPFEIKRTNWNTLDTLKVSDIKTNTTIDDARFSKPR